MDKSTCHKAMVVGFVEKPPFKRSRNLNWKWVARLGNNHLVHVSVETEQHECRENLRLRSVKKESEKIFFFFTVPARKLFNQKKKTI